MPRTSDHIRAAIAVRHQIDDLDLAFLRHPARDEHECVATVLARGGDGRPLRGDPPVALLEVAQQGAEGAGGVEARQAQPVDVPVATDQRPGVAIADQCIVFDGKRHGSSLSAECRVRPGL